MKSVHFQNRYFVNEFVSIFSHMRAIARNQEKCTYTFHKFQVILIRFKTIMVSLLTTCCKFQRKNRVKAGFCKFRGPAVIRVGGYVIAPAFELKILYRIFGQRECVSIPKFIKHVLFARIFLEEINCEHNQCEKCLNTNS